VKLPTKSNIELMQEMNAMCITSVVNTLEENMPYIYDHCEGKND